MSGIPVYTQSPISAAKPSGVTPQTAAPDQHSASNYAPATTTATSTSSYPQARPGAVPAAAPTSAAKRYTPLQPTPTTTQDDGSPPAPQPGARPTPMNISTNTSTLPPPPRAGESYTLPQTQVPIQYPPQMGIPPPSDAIGARPPASSTTTTNEPSSSYPVPISSAEYGRRQSLEHPPGYQQNAYAADLTADQRRARDANSGGAQNSSLFEGDTDQDGVWETAKIWAQQAGQKLQAVEEDVWKKINKEQ